MCIKGYDSFEVVVHYWRDMQMIVKKRAGKQGRENEMTTAVENFNNFEHTIGVSG